VQGNSGDCYFLSSLASLAERPELIRRIFSRYAVREGIYSVWVRVRGVPTEVIVDDYMPTHRGNLVFSKPRAGTQEVWVLILEKAWAKVHGTYEAISGGYPFNVLNSFSTGPIYHYPVAADSMPPALAKAHEDKLKRRLEYANQKTNFPICAGSKAEVDQGLIPNHAYSLIDTVLLSATKGEHLIKLRNPWGECEWSGEFSDNDPIWKECSDEEKRKIGYSQKDNGYFFIPLHKFIKYFDSIDVCHILEGFNYNY
jgi:hypothetical protein